MRPFMHGFFLSLQFLTRLPIRRSFDVSEQSMKWALRLFPVAGLIIGLALALPYWLFQSVLPGYILAFLAVSVWVYITGGLHLDGWMDVADAVGSNAKLERKYEIMKDSRVGSFAVLAVLFLLAWKSVLLYELIKLVPVPDMLLYMIAVPAIARFQSLLQLAFVPAFQNKGMAHMWKRYLNRTDIAISVCLLIPIIIFKPAILLLILAQLLFSFLFGKWAMRQFKGINGDLVGASIEGAELWNLSLLYIYTLYVMG